MPDAKEILESTSHCVIVYTSTMLKLFGTQWLTMEPEIIKKALADEGIHPPAVVLDKIQLGGNILTSRLFNVYPEYFLTVCRVAAAKDVLDLTQMVEPTPEELMVGLITLEMHDGDDRYWPEVIAFVRVVLQHHGFTDIPNFVKELLHLDTSGDDVAADADKIAALQEYADAFVDSLESDLATLSEPIKEAKTDDAKSDETPGQDS